ncbi:MAG: hypothetical protein IPM39_24875 [Chloroflexi bacterium]|nr:hypothetical protein [Chloroflexota bacterium]
MAQWCAGPDKRLPYPRGNWYEDQTWNTLPLQAMRIVLLAEKVFSKPGDEWEDFEINFFDWLWDAVQLYDALDKLPAELTNEDQSLLAQANRILQKEHEYLNG